MYFRGGLSNMGVTLIQEIRYIYRIAPNIFFINHISFKIWEILYLMDKNTFVINFINIIL